MQTTVTVLVTLCLGLGLAAAPTETRATPTDTPAETATPHAADPWFKGSAEQAFAQAKAEKKPLLFYWGAVWCPPCNELKTQVFQHPRFAKLVEPMIAAHLDGDTEEAQLWAERLKVSGYPTVLVFDSGGREVMRLMTSLTMDEFETALVSSLQSGAAIGTVVDRTLAGRASPDDWRTVAYFDWSTADGNPLLDAKFTGAAKLTTIAKLLQKAPPGLAEERALLAAALLESAADAGAPDARDAEAKRVAASFSKDAAAYAANFLDTPAGRRAGRSTIIYSAGKIFAWAYPEPGTQRQAFADKWTAAARLIEQDKTLSIDTRLMSLNPELELLRLQQKAAVAPESLRKKVTEAVWAADAAAKSPSERHAVVSDAAYLLQLVGDYAGARHLLDKELAQTDTPWYYQSDYADVEHAAGNDTAALAWAEKARNSAKGRASKLQWIAADLRLSVQIPSKQQDARIKEIAQEYYATALALPDGFSGRNAASAKKVQDALRPLAKNPELQGLLTRYAKECEAKAAKAASLAPCRQHFAGLL